MKNKGFLPRKNAQFCAASKESCPPSDVSDNPPCMRCCLTAGWYLLDQVLHNNACKTQTDLDIAWTHSFRHHGILKPQTDRWPCESCLILASGFCKACH